MNLACDADRFKKLVKNAFKFHCVMGLYTLEFHFLDDFSVDVSCAGVLELLESSFLARFNLPVKFAYRPTSKRRSLVMEKTVCIIKRREAMGGSAEYVAVHDRSSCSANNVSHQREKEP